MGKRNAIILAAGLSSRFVPLSYEIPKGLLVVKGEVLIERQIRQLNEANITDITVVVGYKAEMFDYLSEKFGATIVLNEDFSKYNNSSSLFRVLDKLGNTFICSSDNYFSNNVFIEYSDYSYYSSKYAVGETKEYCIVTAHDGSILNVNIGGRDSWYMVGHAYFNEEFSRTFAEIMKEEFKSDKTKKEYWEDVYIRNIGNLPKMEIKHYQPTDIVEFDSLEELRNFDEKYVNNTGSEILRSICNALDCEEQDILNIENIEGQYCSRCFYFRCGRTGGEYLYTDVSNDRNLVNKTNFIALKNNTITLKKIYTHPTENWDVSLLIRKKANL